MAGALNRHIALVGFMGAGKSTLGREVAERLGRPFVDVDAEVEGVTGRSISQLFEAEGEAFFRTKEAKVTVERLHTSPPAVLALGGGALGSVAGARRASRARVHGPRRGRPRRSLEPGSRRRASARAGRARLPCTLHEARAGLRRGGGRDRERGRRGRPCGGGGPRRSGLARPPRRARARRRRRARQRRTGGRDPRRRRAGRARRPPRLGARATGRRRGEDDGRGRCALAGAPPRP